jgi:Flp pilus assembly protein TadG
MPTRRRGQGGQSLAEFAIVAPIFFLLVFGVIQIGLVLASQNGLVDGVRSSARRAATYRINEASFDASVFPSICAAVGNELDLRLSKRVIGYNAANLTSTITYQWVENPESGEYSLIARVDARYDNQLYVPLISAFLDGADGANDGVLTLTASEQMRVENPALLPTDLSSHACP